MARKSGKAVAPVDAYLCGVSPDKRAALQRLREIIQAALPGCVERISYGVPGFEFEGRMVVWMAAGAKHCSFFPGGVVQAFAAELKAWSTSKGTVRFPPEHPLPAALVRKLVKARLAATERRPAASAGRSTRKLTTGRAKPKLVSTRAKSKAVKPRPATRRATRVR